MQDWYDWHADYDEPGSKLARRLELVQGWVRQGLDEAPPGPVRVLSLVAGQGRDLIPVLARHSRRGEVRACLVELDERNAEVARASAADAGLSNVEVRVADAGLVDGYADAAPADILMLCGLFGNITDEDIRHTVEQSTALANRDATVVWTRHRDAPDLVPHIDTWFAEAGFQTLGLSDAALDYGVGAHRLRRDPRPLVPGTRLFTFVGSENLRPQ
jgi:hypothetical protein